MVKYQAFIIVKNGLAKANSFIFGAMLHKIFDAKYLKSLARDGQWDIKNTKVTNSKLDEWDRDWNTGNLWDDLNMFIPFYLLSDNDHTQNSNALRDIFSTRLGVDVENLIKSM